MYRIEIPGKTPTLNTFYRQHHMKSYKQKKDWEDIMWIHLLQSDMPLKLKTPIELHVIQYSTKIRDNDNCVIAHKFFADTLVKLNYIKDDSPKYIETTILTSKKCSNKKGEKMVFMIREL